MTTRTASQIGRASRDKGARFERAVATAIKPWFPDVRRSRDNGSTSTSDTGDLADAGPGLFWSLKDDKSGDTSAPGVIDAWLTEATVKGEGRIALLVQKRRGHADPLRSWTWLWLDDLVHLTGGKAVSDDAASAVRMELEFVLHVLAAAGYAHGGARGVAS